MNIVTKKMRRFVAGTLAAFILLSNVLSYFPTFDIMAKNVVGDRMLSGSAEWKFYCIDSFSLLGEAGGVQGTNEWYEYVMPSTKLTEEEVAVLFWATLSFRASKGDKACKTAIENINTKALAEGRSIIFPLLNENDLKLILHLESTRSKYPWIKGILADPNKYMQMAGLLAGQGRVSTGGQSIPVVLQGHTQPATALSVGKNTFTIEFDPFGADRDFIQKVPLWFSSDGGEFKPELSGGWTYQKTDISIIFTNPNPTPSKLIIEFHTDGTEYQSSGGYASAQDAYDRALQLWVCIQCNDRHVYHSQKLLPLEAHQRLTYLELEPLPQNFYASLAGNPATTGQSGSIDFNIYRHEEDMLSTYNVQLNKYDHETGKPLENSVFKLYERFDDKDKIDKDRDGSAHIYEGGEPYKSYHKDNPVTWDDFKYISGLSTDGNGYASKTINHAYHYDKTFCDGHPAPQFVQVPEEELDELTGEALNEDELAASTAENQQLAQRWVDTVAACEDYASDEFDGVHFHWQMSDVDQQTIEDIAGSGGDAGVIPDGGNTASASEEEAFAESGCRDDCQQTYDKFVGLRYSYAVVESAARPGYILHDTHTDDVPIEVITTDASESGAHATFAGIYGKDIVVNDHIKIKSITETLSDREAIAAYQLETEPVTEPANLKKEKKNFIQEILQFLFPDPDQNQDAGEETGDEEEESDVKEDKELVEDSTITDHATSSNAVKPPFRMQEKSTPSNALLATPSIACRSQVAFSIDHADQSEVERSSANAKADYGDLFDDAYNDALNGKSSGDDVNTGSNDKFSHCNGQDGEGDGWRIYDHRTEGEIHINKRDMELQAGEAGGSYNSYGDSQGDGTLEGAVYGLYAATNIIHPDGKSGTIFEANNLVAVATTDKEGDASFMAITEAPGYVYDYDAGKITKTANGWADNAPKNLYVGNDIYDDYTADGAFERTYHDNQGYNGNCWVGRSLLMGNYYVKELTRSEGYELSIANKDSALTNYGQDYTVGLPTGTGYANIAKKPYAEGQISGAPTGEFGNPDINEIFFSAESKGTGAQGYDLVLNNLPAGAKFYRLDSGSKSMEVEAGTGVYDKVLLTNPDGTPKYVVAEHNYQYPKYNPDGSLMTIETVTNYKANQFLTTKFKALDTTKTKDAIEGDESSMTKDQVATKLAANFSLEDKDFLKGKVERALRANGKGTPKLTVKGELDYSSIYVGIYDEGVREGDIDPYGVSGVAPGQPAAKNIYGSPVITMEISKTVGNAPIKVGDAILTVLDYYNTNGFYSYGGIHAIDETADKYLITVYSSVTGNPENFMVLGTDPVNDSTIYHRIPFLPSDARESPRYVYVTYSNNSSNNAFGTYEDYEERTINGTYVSSATLITDAVMEGDGMLVSRTIMQNVYYQTGDAPSSSNGDPIQAFEYREQTQKVTQDVEIKEWTELPVIEINGAMAVHIDSIYTDRYGVLHDDTNLQGASFRILLPEREITLTQDDINNMPNAAGWSTGEEMGSAAYYLNVKRADVKAYLNYTDLSIMGDSSYVQKVDLTYPQQTNIWQDGEGKPGTNTRTIPVALQERPIKQQIKVTKRINPDSYNNTNSYGDIHEDWFTKLLGGFGAKDKTARKMDNFRFKTYLKSNLERIYRDENGYITWQDRKGNDIDILDVNQAYPEKVSKIFTKVLHSTDPLCMDSDSAIKANDSLYGFTDGLINEQQERGYTAVLESRETVMDDGSGTRLVKTYNYEKFFDAIKVVNYDQWDDAAPTNTSFRPVGNWHNSDMNTHENANATDMVRQFAVTWYLDDEIAKLVREVPGNSEEKENADGSTRFSDQTYDEALNNAIRKADNYLDPFFRYDLDQIYAISWDSEARGGNDQDQTTLSADTLSGDTGHSSEGYYYGVSEYLPYGTYVVVEQQPRYDYLEDFTNKHYQTDSPKEVILPAAYTNYDGSQQSPEVLNDYYNYNAAMPQEELERKYRIRYNEESHVIHAHSNAGDFEIYKYGMDIDRITNGVPAAPGQNDYFALTQSQYRPFKNYYNEDDDRATGEVPYYLAEALDGRDEVSKNYRYSSVSEDSGTADDVPYTGGSITEDNPAGIIYRDHVPVMSGKQIAYDGKFASMLVPYSINAPAGADTEEAETEIMPDGESPYVGYSYTKFVDRFYRAKLRIEKLDSVTKENILHDGAIFNIYAAERDNSKDGNGQVKFYEQDTMISGSKEFLEAMGAYDITPVIRNESFLDRLFKRKVAAGQKYTGVVREGTPVCSEEEQIILGDSYGNQKVAFKSYSTVLDARMKDEESNTTSEYQYQTVGYLETPQPLGAGVYVICEAKAPAGYVRSKPVALEIYSDKVSYYKDGNRNHHVLAAIYQNESDHPTANENKPQDTVSMARVYVENHPIQLEIEKKKEAWTDGTDDLVTYRVSGRIDGKLADIGNNPDYIYAYDDGGNYLGYAWKKGTLEYLISRQDAGENVQIIYDGKYFAGYGYITQTLETADDDNKYVVGAKMTLFDALELKGSGDTQDHAYEGLVIERNRNNNVTRMYVKEGYAGEKIDFLKEKDENGQDIVMQYQTGVDQSEKPILTTGNVWSATTIQRHDTDILYYDLDSLDILASEQVDGTEILYGYDRDHKKVSIDQLEADKANINRTDTEHSIFAFRGGIPYLEFVGGDFSKIKYSAKDKVIKVPVDTRIYHIDREGDRDAMVDPYTGMAYVTEQTAGSSERILVWAVNIHNDEYGNVIARDKITTSRIGTIGENEVSSPMQFKDSSYETGYIIGSWRSDTGEESHKETSLHTNKNGQNMNEEVLVDDNNGSFENEQNPVLDSHGLPIYYQRSDETYDKSTDLYDRNSDFVRQQDSDNLEEYNNNAYRVNEHNELYDGNEAQEGQDRKKLYHRLGEAYILENTWTTGDHAPNSPFLNSGATDGQADILKRVPAGTYIMEELQAPEGYVKGMPSGITVRETTAEQRYSMVDKTTKEEISKVDGTDDYTYQIMDMGKTDASGRPAVVGTATELMGTFGFGAVKDAKVALYTAEKIYTTDTTNYPKGYYLKKTGTAPVTFPDTNSTDWKKQYVTAEWTTHGKPIYFEGLPAGSYILEEIQTPSGFVTSQPVEVEISSTVEVQTFTMYDDHTRVEIEKYVLEGAEKHLLSGAGFTLYEAVTDANGNIVYEDGKPKYDPSQWVDRWMSSDASEYRAFAPAFEAMYRQYGTKPGTTVSWEGNGTDHKAIYVSSEQAEGSTVFPTSATMIFQTEDGQEIRVSISASQTNKGGRSFEFGYQFNYKKLPGVNGYANSYLTMEGRQRFDYLPADGTYVLVETTVPRGYAKAADVAITVADTADIQRYQVENVEGTILISKVAQGRAGELAGARLGFFQAGADGELIQDAAHQVDTWITGEDGAYTELDEINKKIPAGYRKGDLKPHSIRRLPSGTYWLVELQSPGYYTAFAPKKIEYRQEDEIRVERVVDVPVSGRMRVRKTDAGDRLLPGVTFELTAYEKKDMRNPVLTRNLSDTAGQIEVNGLPVGAAKEDGSIEPYTYKLKELTPPDGYAASTQVYTWEFGRDNQGISFAPGDNAVAELQVINDKTRISITKRDFDALGDDNSAGAFVAGAEFAVYEITGRDSGDNLIYDQDKLFDTWVTAADGKPHIIIGVVAGHSYLLIERKAPAGYNVMKPVVITISADGRKIASVSNRMNTVSVNYITPGAGLTDTENLDQDSIHSITIKGRYVSKITNEMTDGDGNLAARWIPNGEDYIIHSKDGLEEGNAYTITEKTLYSDGAEVITARKTKTLYFDGNGEYRIPGRTVNQVNLALTHADGTGIDSFSPNERIQEQTIKNNVSPENPAVIMKNRNAKAGDAINPKQAILNTVTYVNTSNHETDMDITVRLDSQTAVIDAGTGVTDGSRLTFRAEKVKPLECGILTFVTETSGRSLFSRQTVTMKFNGCTIVTSKTVPVLQDGKITIYNELTGSGKRIYGSEESRFKIRLFNAGNGEELKGSYAYSGSKTGTLRSGDLAALAGNEYITIDPDIYKNVRYEVIREEDGKDFDSWRTSGLATVESGSCVVYSRHVPDTSEREIFKKGESYVLTETTEYSDGTVLESNKLQVTLNEQAGIDNITALDKKSKVLLSKVEITGEEELPGCLMSVSDMTGKELDTWITGDTPHDMTGILTPGESYIFKEINPAPGYAYANEVTFTVNEDGTIDHVVMVDKPTHVIVSKTDITGELELPGNVMRIKDKDGKEIVSWTSGDQPYEMIGILIAGKTYTLEELRPRGGYAYAEEIQFTVSLDGAIDKVTMKNDDTRLQVQKLLTEDSDAIESNKTATPVEGALLQILNEDKTPAVAANKDAVFEAGQELIFESQRDFIQIIRQLAAGKTYYLHEITPPPGYAYAEDVPFSISLDGKLDTVVMYDRQTHVVVSKTDIAGEAELPGNKLRIKNLAGEVLMSWTSTDKPHDIAGILIAGETYILEEEKPRDGYAYAEEIQFTVSRDGTIDKVIMENDMTHVSILKIDAETKDPLEGAHFLLQNADNVIVDRWISTREAHVLAGCLTADEHYYLYEIKAPYGYCELDAPIEFQVPHGTQKMIVEAGNEKIPSNPEEEEPAFIIFKKMAMDGTYLQNAEFEFCAEDGTLYTIARSDAFGIIKLKMPGDGRYYFKETKAPDGYLLNSERYYFQVRNGQVVRETDTVINYPAQEIVIHKCDGGSGRNLNGARIRIWNDSGWVYEGVTVEDGSFPMLPERTGIYYLQETKAPEGYTLDDTIYNFTVNEDGSVTGTTTLLNYPLKIGRIFASYFYWRGGEDGIIYGNIEVGLSRLPHTGDITGADVASIIVFAAFSLLLAFYLWRSKRKK